jgi:hypothetical protein
VNKSGLWDQLIIGGGTGYGNTLNGPKYNNVQIATYRCPSTPLPRLATGTVPGSSATLMLPTYCGIAGAVPGLIPNYTENRWRTPGAATGCCSGGIISNGGGLPPNLQQTYAHLTDGTSNVMLASEQSDFLILANNLKVAWNAAGPHGWTIGWGNSSTNFIAGAGSGGDNRAFNLTTVRHPINRKEWPTLSGAGNCNAVGICDNTGQNIPLNSAHPGGVMIMLADGSVSFVSDTIPLDVVARLATRDDGLPVPSF